MKLTLLKLLAKYALPTLEQRAKLTTSPVDDILVKILTALVAVLEDGKVGKTEIKQRLVEMISSVLDLLHAWTRSHNVALDEKSLSVAKAAIIALK